MNTLYSNHSAHRASYKLVLGMWHATCKECGYEVSDQVRQRAAAAYRQHIKETSGVGSFFDPLVIDLTREPDARPRPLTARH